jgi:hypothetical protein
MNRPELNCIDDQAANGDDADARAEFLNALWFLRFLCEEIERDPAILDLFARRLERRAAALRESL